MNAGLHPTYFRIAHFCVRLGVMVLVLLPVLLADLLRFGDGSWFTFLVTVLPMPDWLFLVLVITVPHRSVEQALLMNTATAVGAKRLLVHSAALTAFEGVVGLLLGRIVLPFLLPTVHSGLIFSLLALTAVFAGALLLSRTLEKLQVIPDFLRLRGESLLSKKQVARKASQLSKASPPGSILFGGVRFPPDRLGAHFAVMGVTRSGKTSELETLMDSGLKATAAPGELFARALVYDIKVEWFRKLVAMGLPLDHILITNPEDSRCRAWDIAKEIRDNVTLDAVLKALIPDVPAAKDPFWRNTARAVVGSIITAFQQGECYWDLRDVVEACLDDGQLKFALGLVKRRGIPCQLLEEGELSNSIVSTIIECVRPLQTPAYLWHRAALGADGTISEAAYAERGFTVRGWAEDASSKVLLLSHSEEASAAMQPVYQALLSLTPNVLCAPSPHSKKRHAWLFLDELRTAGRIEGLRNLMLLGGEYGVHVVLGVQDVHGVRETFGRDGATELLGQCENIGVLRLETAETRRYASDLFGAFEHLRGAASEKGSVAVPDVTKRVLITDQEFATWPRPSEGKGMHGVFRVPSVGAWKTLVKKSDYDAARAHWKEVGADSTLSPWPDAPSLTKARWTMTRIPWNDADNARLGASDTPSAGPKRLRTLGS